jgi:hypothetical protein
MNDFESIDWASFEGPKWYRPSEVPSSLRAMMNASSEEDARHAYNRVLSAVGNNHAGTIYPAAAEAVPFILETALRGTQWPRWSALEVLIELLSFDAEPGFESVRRGPKELSLRTVMRKAIGAHQDALEALTRAEDIGSKIRASATQVLEALREE